MSLDILNGANVMTVCEYDPRNMDELRVLTKENAKIVQENSTAITRLASTVDTLATYHREMTRWLLVVVCVIALGQKMVEMAKDIWGTKAHLETLK